MLPNHITWIDAIVRDGVTVQFQIIRKTNGKLCADGYFDYTMVSLATGRAATGGACGVPAVAAY